MLFQTVQLLRDQFVITDFLKNLSEQISVLSKNKFVGADELKHFLPEQKENRLPVLVGNNNDSQTGINEREIFYSMLIDMKKDLNALKQIVAGGMPSGDLGSGHHEFQGQHSLPAFHPMSSQPVVIDPNKKVQEIPIEESLSLAEKEKEIIIKALKKHRGRRKEASQELGISDRTLYRKIKEYNISE